ncbi:RE1 [Symbiodinium sp. KB8]|nr:RE1 [Symbiodinium sp. KB8]
MAALLELLRWPAFTNDDEVGQGTEGRFGIPRFNGEPTRLAEYSFRVRARAAKEKAMSKDERDKLGPLELRLVEGLSGTALRMVQNMDMSELSKENGVNTLLEIFEKTLRPKRLQQARELYAAGAATHGIMARQPTEPMATYVLRRRTWYRCLTDCSEDMKLPDLVLAEQLLACSNLSTDHQLLVRTALKGEVTFDAVADELVAQHGRTHERERRAHHKGGGAKHGNRGWTTTTRSWRPSGYMADGNYDTTEDYEDETTFEEEQIGYLVDDGVDLDDQDVAESAASLLQVEQEAHFARKGAAQKGGFRPPPPRQFAVTGSLNLEERKKKVAELKSRTTCRRCGQRGHWQGDPHCPHTKGAGRHGKNRPGTTTTTTSTSASSASSPGAKGGKPGKARPIYFAIREGEPASGDRTAHLALRREHQVPATGADYRAAPPPRGLDAPPPRRRPEPQEVVNVDDESGEDSGLICHNSMQYALQPAEQRPNWVDLEPPAGLTQHEYEDLILQQALGAMEVDTPVPEMPLADLPRQVTPPPSRTTAPTTPTRTTPSSTPPPTTSPTAPTNQPATNACAALESHDQGKQRPLPTGQVLFLRDGPGAHQDRDAYAGSNGRAGRVPTPSGDLAWNQCLCLEEDLPYLGQGPASPPPRLPLGQANREQERSQSLRARASALQSEGKYKNEPVYHAYRDTGYRNWVLANIDNHSGRGMKQLKLVFMEIADYEQQRGPLFTERAGYMVMAEDSAGGSEHALVCVLDTGCNTTCHGSRWLERYLALTKQRQPELLPDSAGGFKGIGGMVRTAGARDLDLCLELADGGYANGSLRSMEIEDSDAPLLLSLEAPKSLGLVLDLSREVAHSQALDRDADPDHGDHHKDDAAEDGTQRDEQHEVSYLAVDTMRARAMSKGQAARHRDQLDNVKGSDRLLWNQVCPYNSRRRPCLPRGCGTFLLEIFGCAMLTGVIHQLYGYPVSMPIATDSAANFDLTTVAGREAVDNVLEADDPYLTVFSPTCTPWSRWQQINGDKNHENYDKLASERRAWLPVVRWMSEDASSLESLEKAYFDMFAFHLTDPYGETYYKKPMALLCTWRPGRGMVWLIHGGIPITASVESLRFATGGESSAKRCLELRPSRKRRREVVEPDEEFEYPFGDDLVGLPVARAGPGDAQQLPFFDASDPDLEEYYPSPVSEAAVETEEPPPVLPPPGLLPQAVGPALPPVTEEAMDTNDGGDLQQEPEAEQVPPSAPPSAPMTYAARRSPKTAAARAKELHLNKADPARRTKMLEARAKEWSNWVGFDATTVLSPEQAKQFLRDNPDTEVVPTRWVDTLKSQPWEEDRRKARMVVRGDHTLAFAASRRQPVQGGDITAAFLQGETITRQLVLALSKDGVEGVEEGSLLVANKPVYGTRDAPRGFWKKLDKVVKKHGLRSVRFEPGAYVLVGPEHRVLGPMVSHVDDLLWTGSPEMNAVMDKVQQVTCPNTAAKVRPIHLDARRRKQRDSPATSQELGQLRSVLGSLNWVGRVCRPDISYELSALQALQKQANVQDLLHCNKLLRYMQETPDVGLFFKYNAVNFENAVL